MHRASVNTCDQSSRARTRVPLQLQVSIFAACSGNIALRHRAKPKLAYTDSQMKRLDSAIQKFTTALERLEAAARRRNGQAQVPFDNTLTTELNALKEDRARLADELTRLNVEKVALEGFTEEVAGRLEGAIREIRAVLAN